MKTEEVRKMSNSSLVNYIAWSPNTDPRDGTKITDITVHHMAGNLSVETCGSVFRSRPASAHYGIGSDGRVGQYVDEARAAWANGNLASNKRSVTIEVANNEIGGNWHVSDTALNKCIDLVTDICKRNGIKKLVYTGTTSGNLTAHFMFQATACPGPYLKSKLPFIASEVTKRLGGDTPAPSKLVVDGLFGELSTMKLQKVLGMTQDGWVGGQTNTVKPYLMNWTTIRYNDGYKGSTTIKKLQNLVKSYNPGTIDGLCGKQTVTALQKFLNAKGFDVKGVDGYFGSNTAKAFQRYLNAL